MRNSIKKCLGLLVLTTVYFVSGAQEDSTENRGFKKEKLFTGGSVSLSFGTGSFLVGVNPVLGYSLTDWADAGIAINYTYASQRLYYGNTNVYDNLRQSIAGGGVFARLFPVRFLFAQVQVEHNFISNKYIFQNGSPTDKINVSATSTLVGAGYSAGREPGSGRTFGYIAILFDVGSNPNSPYKDGRNRSTPIVRGGINIPLFNGARFRD
ncbi:MAG TPA: hypothetical protein VEY06_07735 [Flavisolibacter sp.]|nr:hypothetical protein [Flavisolibacter sp.]